MSVQCANGHGNTAGGAFCSTCGTPITAGPAPEGQRTGAVPAATPSTPHPVPPAAPPYAAAPGAPTGPLPRAAHADSPARSKRKLFVVAATVVLLAAVATGAGFALTGSSGDSATGNGKTIRGIAMLVDTDGSIEGSWDSCEGTGGYDDFEAGMRLSVKGKSDEIVGSGNVVNITDDNIDDVVQAEFDGDDPIGLDADTPEEAEDELRDLLENGGGMLCMLYFEAAIEPSEYYSVELASRGDLSFSRKELDEQGFVVGISLGDI